MPWWFAAPGAAVLVLAHLIIWRWLILLQRKAEDHAERIARIEGREEH